MDIYLDKDGKSWKILSDHHVGMEDKKWKILAPTASEYHEYISHIFKMELHKMYGPALWETHIKTNSVPEEQLEVIRVFSR